MKKLTLSRLFPERMVAGTLFLPSHSFFQDQFLSSDSIEKIQKSRIRTDAEIQKKIKSGNHRIKAVLRGLDGPGSSLDLPLFQKKLNTNGQVDQEALFELIPQRVITDEFSEQFIRVDQQLYIRPGISVTQLVQQLKKKCQPIKNAALENIFYNAFKIENIPATITFPSLYTCTFQFLPASHPNIIEYIAEDFGITHENPKVFDAPVIVHNSDKCNITDLPGFIFINIFNVRGIRIVCENLNPFVLVGGMESSNVSIAILIYAANLLSGAFLNIADIFSLTVKIENQLGGKTGGQGIACCFSPRPEPTLHFWLSGLLHPNGKFYEDSIFMVNLLSKADTKTFVKHVLLLETGKKYVNGKPVIKRTAVTCNVIWSDLLHDQDQTVLPYYQEMRGLVFAYLQALKDKKYAAVSALLNRLVHIRNALITRWLTLALIFEKKKELSKLTKSEQKQAKKYHDRIFQSLNNPYYDAFDLVRKIYQKNPDDLLSTQLYTYGCESLIEKAALCGIAIMPMGAGGPGANAIAVSALSDDEIIDCLLKIDECLHQLDVEETRRIITHSGVLKGYQSFQLAEDQLFIVEGFDQFDRPASGVLAEYDQDRGIFVLSNST